MFRSILDMMERNGNGDHHEIMDAMRFAVDTGNDIPLDSSRVRELKNLGLIAELSQVYKVGEALRLIRESYDVSTVELERRSYDQDEPSLSRSMISGVENTKIHLTDYTFKRYCKYLGVPPEEIARLILMASLSDEEKERFIDVLKVLNISFEES